MRIGLRELGIALVAAALAGIVGIATGTVLYGLVTAGGLGLILLTISRFRQRPIKPGEIVVADWNLDVQLVKVDERLPHQRKAKVWVLGPKPPLDLAKALQSTASHPYAVEVP